MLTPLRKREMSVVIDFETDVHGDSRGTFERGLYLVG
jgi:hypothetical protein